MELLSVMERTRLSAKWRINGRVPGTQFSPQPRLILVEGHVENLVQPACDSRMSADRLSARSAPRTAEEIWERVSVCVVAPRWMCARPHDAGCGGQPQFAWSPTIPRKPAYFADHRDLEPLDPAVAFVVLGELINRSRWRIVEIGLNVLTQLGGSPSPRADSRSQS